MIQTPSFNVGPTKRTVSRNFVQVTLEGGPIKGNLGVILFPDLIKGILEVPQTVHFRVFESGTAPSNGGGIPPPTCWPDSSWRYPIPSSEAT